MWNDNYHGCNRMTLVGPFYKRRQQFYRDYQSKMKTVEQGTLPIMQVSGKIIIYFEWVAAKLHNNRTDSFVEKF